MTAKSLFFMVNPSLVKLKKKVTRVINHHLQVSKALKTDGFGALMMD
jgi:hypothetical protein